MRKLQQDASTVARIFLTTAGASVFEIQEDLDRLAHQVMRPAVFHIHNETDTASIVFVPGMVKTARLIRHFWAPVLHGVSLSLHVAVHIGRRQRSVGFREWHRYHKQVAKFVGPVIALGWKQTLSSRRGLQSQGASASARAGIVKRLPVIMLVGLM
ncbi:hypothetical protein HRbin36_00914 [bacterium HR36]|nr:hypothetical protein HRbin36_00914 [bacterium HR36]